MSAVEILLGAVEPVGVRLRRGPTLVTGATVRARVLRSSDGFELDWSTNTFVLAGTAVQPRQVLAETPAASGLYEYAWDTGTVANPTTPDTYLVEYDQTAPTARAFIRQSEVRVRAAQSISAAVSAVPTGVWTTAVPGAFGAGTAGFVLGTNLNATVSSRAVPGDLMGLVADAITAGKIAVGAVEADAFAADAISASAFSQGAADRVWATATRTLTAGAITSATFAVDAIDASALAASAATEVATAVWVSGTRTITGTTAGAITSASFAANALGAVWDELTAAHVVAGSFGLLVGTDLDAAVSSRATVAGVWGEPVPAAYALGSAGYVLGTNLDALVSSRSTVSGVWSEALPGAYGAGQAGFYLDAQVSSRATNAGASSAVWGAATRTLTSVSLDAGSLTAATIGAGYVAAVQSGLATAVQVFTIPGLTWDEPLVSHTTVGSSGYVLSTLGSGSTPAAISAAVWSEPVPGSFTAGQAGFVLERVRGMTADLTTASLTAAEDTAAAVWATPEGLTSTMGRSLGVLRQRCTNKRVLAADGTLTFFSDDGFALTTVTLTDVNGGPIVVVPGDPAQSTAEV